MFRTTLTNGKHVEIAREQGRGGEVLAIRYLTCDPMTGEVSTAALAAALYVEDVTADILQSLGARQSDVTAALDLLTEHTATECRRCGAEIVLIGSEWHDVNGGVDGIPTECTMARRPNYGPHVPLTD